jgi:hypothetical protein
MPKITYIEKKFSAKSRVVIAQANAIITDYQNQGFTLTLRQLYYQHVSRGFLENTQKNYSRLGNIINDARLAGLIDWDAIEDRTRNVRSLSHWNDPAEIVEACATQFHVDLWATQKNRVELWIEKDALVGVIEGACEEYDVPYFSCRGYVSQSEMWGAAMRAVKRARTTENRFEKKAQRTIVIHFGDHDPSGIDMTRDITDRINMFCARHGYPNTFEMRRLALNMNQVEEYNPPPNFAKVTDSRFEGYQREHGDESWELDALEPSVLDTLIRDEITSIIDFTEFNKLKAVQAKHREELSSVSDRWSDVVAAIEEDRL